ncbi:hypothetical protein EKO27_g9563 [Xylaria grammica]|uniref:Uncharacterized protein n=1 Tax=Xylaria grammica TaxID=363999 RepID=A0A439CTT2_9PEZI|nr:hypothetical protein EKO27_g9563 [Xylaria grammica]
MDPENKENIPPPHDGHEPSWKDDEAYWDQMYPPTPPKGATPLGERRPELRRDVADDCVSFAEGHVRGAWSHIERIEDEYQVYGAEIPEDRLNAIGITIEALMRRVGLAHDLSVLVDQHISDPTIGARTQAVRAQGEAVRCSLHEFMVSMAVDMHLGEQPDDEEEEEEHEELHEGAGDIHGSSRAEDSRRSSRAFTIPGGRERDGVDGLDGLGSGDEDKADGKGGEDRGDFDPLVG